MGWVLGDQQSMEAMDRAWKTRSARLTPIIFMGQVEDLGLNMVGPHPTGV